MKSYKVKAADASPSDSPILAVIVPNPYKEDKVVNVDDRLSVQLDGKRHLLNGYAASEFHTLNQKGVSYFTSPDDVTEILKFLAQNGADASALRVLQQEYDAADIERQRPKVEFDQNGDVSVITKLVGYGKEEKAVRIGHSGLTDSVYLIEEPRGMPSRKASGADPKDVETIVNEVIFNLPEEAQARVQEWYDSIGDRIECFYYAQNPVHKWAWLVRKEEN
jgi:hypothetical protein